MKAPIIFIAAITALSACSMKQGKTEQAATIDSTQVKTEPVLAIDSTLQVKVESILENKLKELDAQSGRVIVMEVQTGAIKASVGTDSILQKSGLVRTVSLLAALETDKVKLYDTIDVGEGVLIIGKDTLYDHNWRRGGYGKITVEESFGLESNIATYKVVKKAFGNEQAYAEALAKYGYQVKDTSLIYNPLGCGILTTPLQNLTFFNAIAIDNIAIRQALEHSVSDGLAKRAQSDKVDVAGATGTMRLSNDEYAVEFCGYFPADNPKYSVIVSINKKGLPASGGAMAGSVFKEIAEYMADELSPDLESLEFRTADTILKTNHKLVMLMDTLYRYTRITPKFLSSTLEDDIEWMNKYRNQLCRYYKANKLGTDTISDYAKADTVIEASRKLWELHSDESTMGLIISLDVEYTRMVFQQYNEYAQLLELCKTNRQKKLLKDEFKAWIDLNDLMFGFCCDCIYLIYCGGTICTPLSLMGEHRILDSHISMYQKDRILLNGNSDSFNENGVSMECAKNQLLDSCRWALKEYIYDDEMKEYIHEGEERERYEKRTIIAKQKVSELPAVISKWVKARESWLMKQKDIKSGIKKQPVRCLLICHI